MILSTFINYYDNLQDLEYDHNLTNFDHDLEHDRVFTPYTLGVIPKYRQY